MNIKELFENGRLYTASVIDSYEHNKCLDRIETKVIALLESERQANELLTARVEELERVLELSAQTKMQKEEK